MRKTAITMLAVVALSLPLTNNAQTVTVTGTMVNGQSTNTACVSNVASGVPIEIILQTSGFDPNCTTAFTVTRPDGQIFTKFTNYNGNVVLNVGSVSRYDSYDLTGTYNIDVAYGCGTLQSHMTLVPVEFFFGSGVASKMAINTPTPTADGSAYAEIELFPQFANLDFTAEWYKNGILVTTGGSIQTFTPVNSVTITDAGGCVETFQTSVNPTGIPVAPLLSKSGSVHPLTMVKVTNRITSPTVVGYKLQFKRGAVWQDIATMIPSGLPLILPGIYRVKAQNAMGGLSYSANITVKGFWLITNDPLDNTSFAVQTRIGANVVEKEISSVELYNLSGQRVFVSSTMLQDYKSLHLPSAVYVLHTLYKDGTVSINKIALE